LKKQVFETKKTNTETLQKVLRYLCEKDFVFEKVLNKSHSNSQYGANSFVYQASWKGLPFAIKIMITYGGLDSTIALEQRFNNE
jgi:hypothetical protein